MHDETLGGGPLALALASEQGLRSVEALPEKTGFNNAIGHVPLRVICNGRKAVPFIFAR